ncbi:hypothetical protein [Blastococcus sp. URHD0036]|uniref:Rv1733c family protein n=1 Tax=Blastococcus sp. URHD0036 TaxID=1380356 RepID=UPI0012DC5E08|nr:hypothetical protein [Blastococcus sp. URHD0036]
MDRVPCGPVRRVIRRFTLGSGELKRPTDRVQMVARFVVVLAVVLAPLPAAVAVGTTTARLQAQATQQAAERHRADAVLLDAADTATGSTTADTVSGTTSGAGAAVVVAVRATWRTAAGAAREGTVLAAPGTPAGAVVQIWLGPAGTPVAPPLTRGEVAGMATIAGVLVLMGLPLAAWALYAALVVALDAHRARGWAQEWAAVEPRWGTRLT